jgi:hypothetical protein
MNERIRELYQQAHMVREYPADDPWRGGNPATVYWGGERSAEKLALLIIQECARIARATPAPDFDDHVKQQLGHTWDMAAIEAGREIIKYFGIEK